MHVRVTISGRHYDALAAAPSCVQLPDEATLDDALAAIDSTLPEGTILPNSCLVAVAGQHVGTVSSHRGRILRDGDEILLIAPVAGG
jgi:sulfur carrier protein ThiS